MDIIVEVFHFECVRLGRICDGGVWVMASSSHHMTLINPNIGIRECGILEKYKNLLLFSGTTHIIL
jgi:hypothetical protein